MNLKGYRASKDLSQYDMAQLLKVHPNTYGSWEKNPGKIPFGKAVEISEILGDTMDAIFLEKNSTKC